jgi:hypothetical protein
LHECGSAELHVHDEGVQPFGELLREDRRGNEGNARDRARHVAQSIELLVSRHHRLILTGDGNADGLHLLDNAFRMELRGEAGDGLQFVERSSSDPETAAGNHRHAETQAGEQRRERQGDLVADAAGGVFVHDGTRIGGELEHVAGIAHGQRQRARFSVGHATKENGHEHGGHLVIGDATGAVIANERLDGLGRKLKPVTFRFNGAQEGREGTGRRIGVGRLFHGRTEFSGETLERETDL